MLRNRILTAIVMASVVLGVLFGLSDGAFAILWAVVILWAGWEWSFLSGIKTLLARVVLLTCIAVSLYALWSWVPILQGLSDQFADQGFMEYSGWIDWFLVPAVVGWVLTSVVMKHKQPDKLIAWQVPVSLKVFLGWLFLVSAWLAISRLRSYYALSFTFYILILVWLADTAAYFAGRKYGKQPMAPHISPGKTVAGMYGALLATAVWALAFSLYHDFALFRVGYFIMLSVLTAAMAVYGDLFVSLLKRWHGVKDTGSLLPGHGGIMDRIDGLIAALPFYYIALVLLYRTL